MSSSGPEIEISDVKAVIPPEGASQAGSEYQRSSDTSSKCIIFLVFLAIIIALVAIIIAAVSLAQNGIAPGVVNQGGTSGSTDVKVAGDIWTFAIGHDGTNIEYIDDTSGTLRGFHVDIVDAVCNQAGRDCRLIWDIYENCWNSQAGQRPRGGRGLMGRWYDACTGWFNTYERSLTVQFSSEFRKGLSGVFYVRSGNGGGFNPANIGSNQKIGFIDGWASDEHCLARDSNIQGVPLTDSQIMHYSTREELQAAVTSGDIAAAFANSNVYAGGELETIGNPVTTCYLGGGSMMLRKDSTLAQWWNPAFEAIQRNGVYADVCDKAATDHGHQPGATGDLLCV